MALTRVLGDSFAYSNVHILQGYIHPQSRPTGIRLQLLPSVNQLQIVPLHQLRHKGLDLVQGGRPLHYTSSNVYSRPPLPPPPNEEGGREKFGSPDSSTTGHSCCAPVGFYSYDLGLHVFGVLLTLSTVVASGGEINY